MLIGGCLIVITNIPPIGYKCKNFFIFLYPIGILVHQIIPIGYKILIFYPKIEYLIPYRVRLYKEKRILARTKPSQCPFFFS